MDMRTKQTHYPATVHEMRIDLYLNFWLDLKGYMLSDANSVSQSVGCNE